MLSVCDVEGFMDQGEQFQAQLRIAPLAWAFCFFAMCVAGLVWPLASEVLQDGIAALSTPRAALRMFGATCCLVVIAQLSYGAWRTIAGAPALEIRGGMIVQYFPRRRQVKVADVAQVTTATNGTVQIIADRGRALTLSPTAYRDGEQLRLRLMELAPQSDLQGRAGSAKDVDLMA